MADILRIVGTRIKNIRKSKNLTQQQLAELVETHHSYIGDLERGNRNITLQGLDKIAHALQVDISDFFITQTQGVKSHPVLSDTVDLLLQQSDKNQQKVLNILREVFR